MELAKTSWLHRCSKLCQHKATTRKKDHSVLSIICALYLSHEEDDDGLVRPLQFFSFLLKEAKSDPEMVLSLHQCIIRCGLESDPSLGCILMHFYLNFQKLEEINMIFSFLDHSNVHVWSIFILAHVKLGHSHMAILLYTRMVQMSIDPTVDILVSVFNACAASLDLHQGMSIHLQAIQYGLDLNVSVGNSLIHMYIKCGKLYLAERLFAKLPLRNVVTWNSLMSGKVRNGFSGDAILIFMAMLNKNVIELNDLTFASGLKACCDASSTELGLKIHGYYTEIGCKMNSYVGNSLITMYVQCGLLDDARVIFDMLLDRTIVSWNTMIGGYCRHGYHHKVLELIDKMQEEKWLPDPITIVFAIKACSCMEAIEDGVILHSSMVVENIYESNVFIGNGLIVLYANHGRILDALSIFHNLPERSVSTWNSIIGAFVLQGSTREALILFESMQDDVQPNDATFVSVLKACCSTDVLYEGRRLHAIIFEFKSTVELNVGTCLLDMYAKCGSLHDACIIFEGLPKQNLITWNAMITAYAQYGKFNEAFYLFDKLQQCGLKPSTVTYIGVLKACCHEEAEIQGKIIHAHIVEGNCTSDISVGNVLVGMYLKCGNIEDAKKLIMLMPTEHARTLNALILAHIGINELSQCNFQDISGEGLGSDGRMMVSVLSTYKHHGLVEDGCSHFKYMWENFGASPLPEHYGCMGDLLGRAGHLNEAKDILQTMPLPSGIVTSTSLITHCKMHGNVDIGKNCFDKLNAG